ncbi:MAG: VanZ family protein [Alphaproteobacteria bacterium]|nr:VanZ family protein [Alphaproteobacteria bacterium]
MSEVFAVWRKAAPVLFVMALAVAFIGAVWPDPSSDQVFGSDKVLHIFAFSVLSFLGFFSIPKGRVVALGVGLSLFGAAIEFFQGLSFVGRDADFQDWIADTVAVIVVLLILRGGEKILRVG